MRTPAPSTIPERLTGHQRECLQAAVHLLRWDFAPIIAAAGDPVAEQQWQQQMIDTCATGHTCEVTAHGIAVGPYRIPWANLIAQFRDAVTDEIRARMSAALDALTAHQRTRPEAPAPWSLLTPRSTDPDQVAAWRVALAAHDEQGRMISAEVYAVLTDTLHAEPRGQAALF